MRGGFRGEGGVVATPDATSIGGVTPTAAGLALLDDADAAAQRTTLGLGTIATQAANSVSISGGSVTGITDLAVADGGTGASTTLLARAGLSANGGTWRTTSSGTDTLVAGDGVVEYTASCTITLPSAAASGVFVGKTITLIAATAGIVLTLTRAGSDTLNGGTSTVAVTMATVRSTLAVVAQSSSAWGSLQPGSAAIKRITATVIGGAFVAYGESWIGGAWVQITPTVTSTLSGDPDGLNATVAGTVLSWGNGSAVIGTNLATEAQYVGWALAAIATSLGLDSIRPLAMQVLVDTVSVTSGSAGDYSALFGAVGTGSALATDMTYAVGVRVNNAGNSASRAVTGVTGVGSTGGTTGTVRRAFFAGATPFAAAALGYVYAYDTSDVIVNSLAVSNTLVAGTPTHLFVCWGASTNQKTTSFTAPIVRLYL